MRILEGISSSCLKIVSVTQIFKSGKKDQTTSYRPNTTLPVWAKKIEKLPHKRLICFINSFNLLNANQFGFFSRIKHIWCSYRIFGQSVWCYRLKQSFVNNFLRFRHSRSSNSSKKIYHNGFRRNSLDWLRTFWSSRFRFVEDNQHRSSLLGVNIDAPQGSTPGPLLFILYINDANEVLTTLKDIHFADDTTLYLYINPSTVHTSLINSELAQVETWQMQINYPLMFKKLTTW